MDVREKFPSEKRLIDADALIHRLLNTKIVSANLLQYANAVTNMIGEAPTIESEPVRHGRWIICSDGYYPYCSECKEEPKSGNMTKYCPNCGAKMDGDSHEA